MPIGGSATELNITGAKLKVTGGVDVTGSIAYATDATGFGSVTAQIDGNNTLNITSGKNTGVAKIERATAATITAITHTNVNNNTTIHLALKNTATSKGVFITLGTFASDDTVKVNYTDEYSIGPGETGMVTLRKVNGVASVFVREMFTSKATSFDNTDNSPFYIKDGVNYKYPLYKFTGTGLTSQVIQGTTYFRPDTGLTTKTRPPKGLPDNTPVPSGTFKIGNNNDLTTINYDVYGTSGAEAGSLYRGSTQKARFGLDVTHNEASGSFTDSGVSSGDTYTLYLDKTATTSTDTVSAVAASGIIYFAFHHGTFADSGNPYSDASITAAASAGRFYSDTAAGTYGQGVLSSGTTTDSNKTTYTFTTNFDSSALLVAGGGGGGGHVGGGGGAGGLVYTSFVSSGSKTIVVGNGGTGSAGDHVGAGSDGSNTSFTGLDTAIGGGGGGAYHNSGTSHDGRSGGSGGGGGHGTNGGAGTSGQGHAGGNSPGNSACAGGGGAGGASLTPSANADHSTPGGPGLDQSSVFGTTYGVSGVFAGGGGGGHRASQGYNAGSGGSGGGGAGGAGANGTSATKHTGGGGGGGSSGSTETGGNGGSGIVILKNMGSGKNIPKVLDVVVDSTNVSNVLISTQGTGISTVTYIVNSGSELSTPVNQLSVSHGLTPPTTGTVLAYALDASSAQLGVKLSKSIQAVYGYETITLTDKTNSQTITYAGNGTTDVTNTYKSSGGNTWNGGWILLTGYTAPVTFEYKCAASSGDDGNSYKQIGINDTVTQSHSSGHADFDIYHYAYYKNKTELHGSDITDESHSYTWNSTDSFYIVYKSDGVVEWWHAGTKIKDWSWGTGKTVYLSASFWKQGNGTDHGSFKNIRVKRRQWDGTKYIN